MSRQKVDFWGEKGDTWSVDYRKMEKAKQTIGKEGELRVIGELLKRDFDIYLPLVDILGIDCIIRTEVGYKEIQVKTREFGNTLLFDVKEFKPKNNFYIICYYIKEPETYWVFPSKIYIQHAYHLKKFKKYRLLLGPEDSSLRKKLHVYRNNFFQLKEGTEEATSEIKQKIKKSGWQVLKDLYPSVGAVEQKLEEAREKNYSNGYIKVLENLRNYWKKRV